MFTFSRKISINWNEYDLFPVNSFCNSFVDTLDITSEVSEEVNIKGESKKANSSLDAAWFIRCQFISGINC